MVDSCALPVMAGIHSFSFHVVASLYILLNAPMTMDMIFTFEAWFMLFTSNVSYLVSLYYFFFLCLYDLVSRYSSIYKYTYFFFFQQECYMWSVVLEFLVRIDVHVRRKFYLFIIADWHGLVLVPFAGGFWFIFLAYLPMNRVNQFEMPFPILFFNNFESSTGFIVELFITQSQLNGVYSILSILRLMKFVLNTCFWATSIIPSASFFKNWFLSHLLDSWVYFLCLLVGFFMEAFLFSVLFLFIITYFLLVLNIQLLLNTFSLLAVSSIHSYSLKSYS